MFLEFTRKSTIFEKGVVGVEVTGEETSISEVYKKAMKKQFKEFLISDREYDLESMEWEFELMKEDNDGTGPQFTG